MMLAVRIWRLDHNIVCCILWNALLCTTCDVSLDRSMNLYTQASTVIVVAEYKHGKITVGFYILLAFVLRPILLVVKRSLWDVHSLLSIT